MFIDVLITMEGRGYGLENLGIKVIYDYTNKKQVITEYSKPDLEFALANEGKPIGFHEEAHFKKVKAVFISGKYFITTDF